MVRRSRSSGRSRSGSGEAALFRVGSKRSAAPPSAAGASPTIRPQASFGYSARAWATIASRIAAGKAIGRRVRSPPVDAALEGVLHLVEVRRERAGREVLPAAVGEQRDDRAGRPSRAASRAAATRTAPHDGPAKMPSRKTRSRSAAIASRFETRYFASISAGSKISGTNPSSSERRPWTVLAGEWLGGDDPDARLVLAQVARHAHQRPGRARGRRRRRRSPGSRRGSPGRSSRSGPAGWPGCRTGTA